MLIAWTILVIELLIFFILKPVVENYELFSLILILINIPFVFYMIAKYQKKIFVILFLGFFIRLMFMFWDVYGKSIFELPHSGGDSERFLATSMEISKNLSLIDGQVYGGLYSKIMGVVFFFGPLDRMVGQYINVLLGITTIVLVWKILKELNLDLKIRIVGLAIITFFPSAIIFSSIFLRESLVSFLVVFSF